MYFENCIHTVMYNYFLRPFFSDLGALPIIYLQTLEGSLSRSIINWFRKLYCRTILAENILLSEKKKQKHVHTNISSKQKKNRWKKWCSQVMLYRKEKSFNLRARPHYCIWRVFKTRLVFKSRLSTIKSFQENVENVRKRFRKCKIINVALSF